MNNIFECKVKYTKRDSHSGIEKKVSESYLVDAVDFIEAQTRIYTEMEKVVQGEFELQSIKKVKYSEIIEVECDNIIWYKGKISFVALDEKSNREKKISNNILVTASSVENANVNIKEAFRDMTVDFTIEGIADSKIVDYFKYQTN